jgi:hypothetical protein
VKRLTDKGRWDGIYQRDKVSKLLHTSKSEVSKGCFRPYHDYLLMDIILKGYLPNAKHLKVLEDNMDLFLMELNIQNPVLI